MVNHVYAEEAEDAPGVIFGEFLVQSALPQCFLILEHRIPLYPPTLWKSMIYLL